MPPYYYQFTLDITLGAIQGQIMSTLASGCTPGVYLYSGNVTAPDTLALTCQAAQDMLGQADPAVTFSPVKTGIMVTADQTTANIP